MPVTENYLNEKQGVIWLQPDGLNTTPQPLLCADLDGIDEPQGDVTTRLCRNADGSWSIANRSVGSPGDITFDLVISKPKVRNWIQQAFDRGCPVPIYVPWVDCGRMDVFLNYRTVKILKNAQITSRTYANAARGRFDQGDTPEITSITFSMNAEPDSPEIYPLLSTIGNPASEDEPLRDITTCSVPRCASGDCGAIIDPCDELHIIADAATAYVTADGYESGDNGATWSAWASSPFSASDDLASLVCFMIDGTTERILVADGTPNGATAMQVSYSDDGGTTWTLVTVGSTNNEYALHSGALFALNYRNIWLCTSDANVYFSSDGGVTWTDQGAPAPAANEGLNYVHFIDENYGWSVGGFRTTPTGLFIQTTDGGDHWTLATAEPKIEMGVWVAVIDANRVWVGLDDGTVYYSNDWGTTWTQRTLPSTLINTGDGQFLDEYIGAIVGYKTGTGNGVPVLFRTFNGGNDWEEYNHSSEFDSSVEYYGLNALLICGPNEFHAIGEAADSVSIVWTLKPSGF